MKRILLTLTTSLLSIVLCSAGDGVTYSNGTWRPSDEISISYGRASYSGCVYVLGGFLGTVFTAGMASPSEMSSTGVVGLEYFHYVHPHVAVGGLATYECYNLGFKTYSGKDENGNAVYKDGDVDHNHIVSVMPVAKFPWMAFEHVSLYSKVGVGCMLIHKTGHTTVDEDGNEEVVDPETTVGLAFQINPVGVEFGGTNHKGFVELGFGCQGMISAGYRIAF